MDDLETKTRTIKISADNIEAAVLSWLYSVGGVSEEEDVLWIDLGLDVDDEGMVSVEIEHTIY